MVFYAIRQKSTGSFLPQRKSRKGFTHTEPSSGDIPRLFKRPSDAQNALNYWLAGKMQWQKVEDTWMGPGEWSVETFPQPRRDKADMEVVQVCMDLPRNGFNEGKRHP